MECAAIGFRMIGRGAAALGIPCMMLAAAPRPGVLAVVNSFRLQGIGKWLDESFQIATDRIWLVNCGSSLCGLVGHDIPHHLEQGIEQGAERASTQNCCCTSHVRESDPRAGPMVERIRNWRLAASRG